MKYCEICGKQLHVHTFNRCTFSDLIAVEKTYDLCPECKTQVEKFIKFQSFRNTEEDDWK